jgi:L-fucose mutarotase
MLKGLDPLLDGDLLYALAAMGHGDELAIVDRNFPAVALARRLIRLTGSNTDAVATAIFSVFPVDTYVDEPIVTMQVVGRPEEVPAVQVELREIASRAEGRPVGMGSLPRMEFYQRAKDAFAIVVTGESRGYGNFLISKGGVAGPADRSDQ